MGEQLEGPSKAKAGWLMNQPQNLGSIYTTKKSLEAGSFTPQTNSLRGEILNTWKFSEALDKLFNNTSKKFARGPGITLQRSKSKDVRPVWTEPTAGIGLHIY